jgi:hypothetical protein
MWPLSVDSKRVLVAQQALSQGTASVVNVFPLDLAGIGGQKIFQQLEVVFHPIPPTSAADQAWRREGRLLAGLVR